MVVRFDSPLYADRAAACPCLRLDDTTLVSIAHMNSRLAKYLDLHISADGLVEAEASGQAGHSLEQSSLFSNGGRGVRQRSSVGKDGLQRAKAYQVPSEDSHLNNSTADLYLLPRRQKNICERLIEYFWSY